MKVGCPEHIPYGALPAPQNYTEQENIECEGYLARRNIQPILDNTRLFWLVFCKAFQQRLSTHSRQMYEWRYVDDQFIYQAHGRESRFASTEYTCTFYRGIELTRNALLECFSQGRPMILCQHIAEPSHHASSLNLDVAGITSMFLSETVDHSRYALLGKVWSNGTDHSVFFSCFSSLINQLGLGMLEKETQQSLHSALSRYSFININFYSTIKTHYIGIESFVIIPRPSISEEPGTLLTQRYYDLYKNQKLCDTVLNFSDGAIKVHSAALYVSGIESIQNMIDGPMLESSTKTISFPEFSRTTGLAFIEFIYLGTDTLTKESIAQNGVNLCELLHMAHMYSVKPLIEYCAYLLGQIASQDDKERIRQLAQFYENPDLMRLYEHLNAVARL